MKRLGEMDVTLVAFYGQKPDSLRQFVKRVQSELQSHLGDAFSAYELEQVHGTIVGLEGRRAGAEILNTNYSAAIGRPCVMDLVGFLRFVVSTQILPLRIRIGGFVRSVGYPFSSRGLHPYFRSFALRGQIAVAMGWPVESDKYPMSLDALRRQFMKYNVLHKYHEKTTDIDNDFFFVLGRVESGSVSKEKAESLQEALRELLSGREPLDIDIGQDQLSLVAYVDTQLPKVSSVRYPLALALEKIDEIRHLYREQ